MAKILVTGATGKVGSSAVAHLKGRASVRAFVRDPEKAARMLGDDVELAVGDFENPDSVKSALKGMDELLLSSGEVPEKLGHEIGVIDAAVEAGIGRIVKVSTIHAMPGSPLPPLDWHGQIEDHLRVSGVPFVLLQSNFYMTNLLGSAPQIREGMLFAPAGDGRIAMIDPRDTGEVAAEILAGEGHEGRTYMLTGPEPVGYRDVAQALSSAIGREVRFIDVSEEQAWESFVQAGMPDWLVKHLIELFRMVKKGDLSHVTDTFKALTGHRPRTFAEFARDRAALFAGSPLPSPGLPEPT
ncbi:MAG: SDR family oxidoreductase [Actinomycetota bacterium]|nr:SDR family oxidoreductase [Actinomycetota bacterium]